MLAYLLKVSPDVDRIRNVVRKRLLDQPRIEAGMKQLTRMLITLHEKGFVKLEPEPPKAEDPSPQPPPPRGEGEKEAALSSSSGEKELSELSRLLAA